MALSTAQKLVKFFSSKKKFKKIQEDSEKWVFTCTNCQKSSSIWDIGGIRYKASGKPNIRIRCPHCEVIGMQKISNNKSN